MNDNDTPQTEGGDLPTDPYRLGPVVEKALFRVLPDLLESDPEARKAFLALFRSGEAKRILANEGRIAVEESVRDVLDSRIGKLEKRIDKKVTDASSSIMATLRGSIEGKVLAALSSATHSKEFRDLLQEITIFSAQQALKDSAGPLFEQLSDEFRKTLDETLDQSLHKVEARVEEIVQVRLEAFTQAEGFADAIRTTLKDVAGDVVAPAVETLGEGLRRDLLDAVRGQIGDLVTSLKEELGQETAAAVDKLAGSDALRERIHEMVGERLVALEEKIDFQGQAAEASATELEMKAQEREEALEQRLEELKKEVETAAKTAAAGEDLEKKIQAVAKEVVDLVWENRILPQLGEATKGLENVAPKVIKEVITSELLQERVRVLAGEERREARKEFTEIVDEVLASRGITDQGVPRDVIENQVSEIMSASLKDVKALAKRIEPLIREKVEEMAQAGGIAGGGGGVDASEVASIVEPLIDRAMGDRLAHQQDVDKKLASLRDDFQHVARKVVKERVAEELSGTVQNIANSPEVKKQLEHAISEELVENAILDRAIQVFLARDEIKEMIDDRFRTIRMFLKNEEIPKVLDKLLKKRGIE